MTRNGQRLLMLIDDDAARRRQVATIAARAGWRTIFANDGEMALAMFGTQDGMQLDAILLDHREDSPIDDHGAAPLIAQLRAYRPQLPILMLTGSASVAQAVAAMRSGATDYLVTPLAPQRLLAALEAAVAGSVAGELRPLTEKIPAMLGFDEIVGSAPEFRAALAIAAKAARARPRADRGRERRRQGGRRGGDPCRFPPRAQSARHRQLRRRACEPDRERAVRA